MSATDQQVVERASARIGTTLRDKYKLERVLGAGGMAVVYKATHRNGKEFAVKVLHQELSLLSDVRTRFLREGYVANKVKHPGAVSVIDDDVAEDGAAFLVMELLDGHSVEELWEQQGRKLPLAQVLTLGHQLASVLAAAHANGIVHRDIKPANLFLTTDGQLKVLDFGIARLREVATSHATQTGMTMGTPAFMAPEQAMAKMSEIDGQTDLWSAGATMFTLASGELVHNAENTQQLLIIAATTPAKSFASVMPTAPAPAVKVIDRALAFEKQNRWASAAEMRDALRDAYATIFSGAPPSALLITQPPVSSADPRMRTAPMESAPRASAPPLVDVPSSARGSTQPLQPTPARAMVAEARPRLPGLVTEQPVARDRTSRAALGSPKLLLPVVGGAVLLVTIVIVVVLTTRGEKDPRGSTSTASSSAPAATSATAPPVAQSAPLTIPSLNEPTVTIDQLPVASTKPSAKLPVAPPPVSPPGATVAAPTKPTATTPPKANCNPPYVIDGSGTKKWKAECL